MTQPLCYTYVTQPLKILKISFPLALFVQSIQGLSNKNTEVLSFVAPEQ